MRRLGGEFGESLLLGPSSVCFTTRFLGLLQRSEVVGLGVPHRMHAELPLALPPSSAGRRASALSRFIRLFGPGSDARGLREARLGIGFPPAVWHPAVELADQDLRQFGKIAGCMTAAEGLNRTLEAIGLTPARKPRTPPTTWCRWLFE